MKRIVVGALAATLVAGFAGVLAGRCIRGR
jgi:hypothetical protein